MEADEYIRMDQVESGMWWYRALHARLLDALVGQADPVLDAGCGTGGFLARLHLTFPTRAAFGIEWNAGAARAAATKSALPVVQGSVNALPFAAGSFGTVIAADVLCHEAVEPAAALAEVRRVLRPGGRVIVNMPAYRSLMSKHDLQVHNARRMDRNETRAMLEQAGLSVVRLHYWNGLLLPLMVAHRKWRKAPSGRSDVAAFPPWLDEMLHGMTQLERRLPFPLPAGGSVLAIAERP